MQKTIIYFVSEDWYFCSHRLPVARIAFNNGFRVVIVTKINKHEAMIKSEGFEVYPIEINRGSFNPIKDIKTIVSLYKCYKIYQPDIVHHVAIKPVIYGTLVARMIGAIKIVNAMTGLGFVFVSDSIKAKIIRFFVHKVFRFLFANENLSLILQNKDDSNYFLKNNLLEKRQVCIIRGSGVDIKKFNKTEREYSKVPIIMLASRMLWDKGVGEFVDAAKIIKKRGFNVHFVLVGDTDSKNPASISNDQLHEWSKSKIIEYWGRRDNMHEILNQACIVCLPSYREGLPKVLLEAASCEKPIITTNVPGCREIVSNGDNGILVLSKDVDSIVDAIEYLLNNPIEREEMGRRGRKIVESNFSEDIIALKTLKLYKEILCS